MMTGVAELFDALDALDGSASTVTSYRQPAALRDAVRIAVELGLADSPNEVVVDAVRSRVEAFAQSLALDEHVAVHPHARPTLGDLAIAAAELDGHPLADQQDFLRRCADEVADIRPDANGEDVLLYAAGRQAMTA
jgi:hypothetical protein